MKHITQFPALTEREKKKTQPSDKVASLWGKILQRREIKEQQKIVFKKKKKNQSIQKQKKPLLLHCVNAGINVSTFGLLGNMYSETKHVRTETWFRWYC